ncbi:MAG TPA: galactose ABC transporter substrate-binding protein [Candidatus Intestinimonas pullistercoris]|uniref:D-galactose/methyl-galactoside binding periplasmic protein MglB n=1 Tax=Candidatus Intestinimonas pullistercoris TaxID=2838623 RepID=A0A9D2NXA9_9FIRM|nr:galactose ABC transporter substrate-binding protein [uncultured Intestinimonas sp.]HJC40150.1 galactose ABC transporter substrate-binding protein [Candidatus Intestinimonas pullistercoris]
MKFKKLSALLLSGAMCLSIAACSGGGETTPAPTTPAESGAPTESGAPAASDLNVAVFYYNYSDAFISNVRNEMDAQFEAIGITPSNYDGNTNQGTQMDQVNTAIANGANVLVVNAVEASADETTQSIVDAAQTAGIPVIFFNREVSDDVVNSYELAAFVGTDPAEAGHMQGELIGNYLVENYDAVDLNGDGVISYVMFKGQENNPEAEYRTQYSVEDANAILEEAGHPALSYYDSAASTQYLVDPNGSWSAAAAQDYMTTILSAYSEANGNMVELVIANNDDMGLGAITALQTAGYNQGVDENGEPLSTNIPVFTVDGLQGIVDAINAGTATGAVGQSASGLASAVVTLVQNYQADGDLMSNTEGMNVDETVAKIRVPYTTVS